MVSSHTIKSSVYCNNYCSAIMKFMVVLYQLLADVEWLPWWAAPRPACVLQSLSQCALPPSQSLQYARNRTDLSSKCIQLHIAMYQCKSYLVKMTTSAGRVTQFQVETYHIETLSLSPFAWLPWCALLHIPPSAPSLFRICKYEEKVTNWSKIESAIQA